MTKLWLAVLPELLAYHPLIAVNKRWKGAALSGNFDAANITLAARIMIDATIPTPYLVVLPLAGVQTDCHSCHCFCCEAKVVMYC
jgi:hypothetical protein